MVAILPSLQVVAVRYRRSVPHGSDCAIDGLAASGVYRQAGVPVDVAEPVLPAARPHLREERRTGCEAEDLGALGGAIAAVVARARREGKAILLTGGNCSHATGVVGGLQDAHGPGARIGLIWFDAHGDFNTPQTTLTGHLGGMPVAVCAGLAHGRWREEAHIAAPLPTDRILMVGLRNLDPEEERLIHATGLVTAAPAPGFPGQDLGPAVADLAARCDMLYLHIDQDILDASLVPHHRTGEPGGPDMAQVRAAIETVMATGKVVAYAVVSVYCQDEGDVDLASGVELVASGLRAWRRYGLPAL